MATFTVTTTDDVVNAGDGVLSLREAVSQANATAAADTIVFASAIEGQTLVLTGGELTASRDLTIDGNQNNDESAITISGNRASRILDVTGSETDVSIRDLTMTGGRTEEEFGGAIHFVARSLSISNSSMSDNYAYGGGGAVRFNGTNLNITNSAFFSNEAGAGGAILIDGGDTFIASSNFIQNGSYVGGAIRSNSTGKTLIQDSMFLQNSGRYDGGALFVRGDLALQSCQVSHCSARGTYGFQGRGGGIEVFGSASITDSTISYNSSDFGGGIRASGDVLEINNTYNCK